MKLLYILLTSLFNLTCMSQNLTCEDFKIGTFKYNNNEQFSNTVIVRTDSLQTETDNTQNFALEGKISWTSECSYDLTYTKCPFPKLIGQTINVTIDSIKENIAFCTCKSKDYPLVLQLEMEKINNIR